MTAPRRGRRARPIRPGFAMLALAGLGSVGLGGCAMAPLASGPLMSAIQLIGDRSVDRTFAADRGLVAASVADTFMRMGLRVHADDCRADLCVLHGEGEGLTVTAKLASVTPSLTRVAMTVETGKITSDKQTSTEILNQVGATVVRALTPAGAGPEAREVADAQVRALSALRDEIRQIRRGMEDRDSARATSSAAPPSAPAVIVVPTSYGIPAPASGPPGPPAPAWVPTSVRPSSVAPAAPAGRRAEVVPSAVEAGMLAAPLDPVAGLVPIAGQR